MIRVAKIYLNRNHAVISVMLPVSAAQENIKKISSIMKKEPVVVSTDKNITKYLLPGDITLIINHNKLNDIVAMQIISKGGNYIEKKAGTGAITAAGMMKGTNKDAA